MTVIVLRSALTGVAGKKYRVGRNAAGSETLHSSNFSSRFRMLERSSGAGFLRE
jgi:hypothetical protein